MRLFVLIMLVMSLPALAQVAPDGRPQLPPESEQARFQRLTQEAMKQQIPAGSQAERELQFVEIARRAQLARQMEDRTRRFALARSTLQTLRDQIDRYKSQHKGTPPTLAELDEWTALLKRTDVAGKYSDTGEFGPYIIQQPNNPLGGGSAVTPIREAISTAGWAYDPATGNLRLIVRGSDLAEAQKHLRPDDYEVPQPARDREALALVRQADTLRSTLGTIRTALERYRADHKALPTLAQMEDFQALLQRTDDAGRKSETGKFGPYLQPVPKNTVSGRTRIVAAGKADPESGWTYDEKTGAIKGVVATDKLRRTAGLTRDEAEVPK